MRSLFLFFFLAVLGGSSSGASLETEGSASPPIPPMESRAPEFAHWTVVYTYTDGYKDGAPVPKGTAGAPSKQTSSANNPSSQIPFRIKEVDYTKTGSIMHVVTTYTREIQENCWIVDGKQMVKQTGFPFVFMLTGHKGGMKFLDFSRTDFPDVEWIFEGNFIGEKAQDGIKYWAFQKSGILEGDFSNSNSSLVKAADSTSSTSSAGDKDTVLAEVDQVSHLPVLLQSPNQTRRYQFDAPPAEMLQVEPDFQKFLDHLKLEENAYALRPAIRTISPTRPNP